MRTADRWTLVADGRTMGGIGWIPMVQSGRRLKAGERIEVVPATPNDDQYRVLLAELLEPAGTPAEFAAWFRGWESRVREVLR